MKRGSRPKKVGNAPYGLLARFYDELMPGIDEMNRQARLAMLGPVLDRVSTACDLACGSGHAALDLARRGIRTRALDLSPVFCARVRAAARAAGLSTVLTVEKADMRDFRLKQPVDLLLLEFAAINNLDDRDDLDRLFAAAAGAVRSGGWFLFDANMPLSFATQVDGAHFWDHPEFKVVMRGTAAPDHLEARLDFDWFLPKGRLFSHSRETIVNVCWTRKELLAAARRAGFGRIKVRDGVDVRPPMAGAVRGTDLYFLARRD